MLYNRRTHKMKKTLLLFAALCMATLGSAQQPFATLTHNDSVQVFYGMNALQQAHAAAVDGDVINLSSGAFNAVDITKALTIRGQGMFNDDSIGLVRTRILNSFTVEVPDTVNRLTLIGLNYEANMNLRVANNPLFLKCRFQTIEHQTGTDYHTSNAVFINCIVGSWYNKSYTSSDTTYWYATGTAFYNSVILGQTNHNSPAILVNCVALQDNVTTLISNKIIMNSIVYCLIQNSNYANNGYTCFNTIGINYYYNSYTGNRIYFDMTDDIATHNLHYYTSFAQVFQTFRNNYSDGMSMALNDDIATTILGDDGTQVGIYGGQYPWDDKVSNPLIGHFSAARRTNTQGNLEVDIEVINNNE